SPFARLGREAIERFICIASRNLLAHSLEAGIGEVSSIGFDSRKFVCVFKNDRDVASSAQIEEFLVSEAFMPRLDSVAERDAFQLTWNPIDEGGDVVVVELTPPNAPPQCWSQ